MVVKRVESGNGSALLRFEPDCYRALQLGQAHLYASSPDMVLGVIERVNRCTVATAEMIFASSWGLYQDMGFELYGELFPAISAPTVWDWLGRPVLQDLAFGTWCTRHGFQDQGRLPAPSELARFAREYNGPDAVDQYSAWMTAAAAQLAGG